jgi:hypothetical protein
MDRAKPRRLFLVLAGLGFFGWIGWLAYLAFTTSRPDVLSRPQFLLSNVDVIAQIDSLDKPVTVEEITYPTREQDKKRVPHIIKIENLAECQDHGWQHPGRYVLPLTTDDKTYRVAPTPPVGVHWDGLRIGSKPGPPRIYLETAATRAQLRQIHKSE